jgi:UDP-GlcNAc3NAcA epimerase
MLKVASIVGARPQFIKAAALTRVLDSNAPFEHLLVHTGQHYDETMSEVFFQELEIPRPDYNLEVGSGTHGAQTGKMLGAIEDVLLQIVPDIALVFGDTNSTLAGALAAAKLHIPVAHVEAGLRSFNRRMPEEINRVLTDHASDLLFAPTAASVENLANEGIAANRIFAVGDVMYDVALYYGEKAETRSRILEYLHLKPKQYVLATIHRAENTDDDQRLRTIFGGLELVAREVNVVVPLHPRTLNAAKRRGIVFEHVQVIEPVGYLDMVMLEKHSRLIATDSGGVQKEAFFYNVPCVTLRSETEWLELLELGWNRVVPPSAPAKIAEAILENLDRSGASASPYGNGDAARKIIDVITDWPELRAQ